MAANRFSRQESIVPEDKKTPVTIIGVGAIGLQLAKFMASMGVPSIRLIDFDRVEDVNITTQGYHRAHIGSYKVNAAKMELHKIDEGISIITVRERWRPSVQVDGVVFCCVDSIKARECIWNGIKNKTKFFCDARMLAEVFHVYTWCEGAPFEDYEQTLFTEEETIAGQCTASGTIYCAAMAAGAMAHQYTRWIRGVLPPDIDWSCALLSSELSVTPREFVPPPVDTGILVTEVIVEQEKPVEESTEPVSETPIEAIQEELGSMVAEMANEIEEGIRAVSPERRYERAEAARMNDMADEERQRRAEESMAEEDGPAPLQPEPAYVESDNWDDEEEEPDW